MLRPPSKERSEKTVAGLAPFTAADFEALHGLRPDQVSCCVDHREDDIVLHGMQPFIAIQKAETALP